MTNEDIDQKAALVLFQYARSFPEGTVFDEAERKRPQDMVRLMRECMSNLVLQAYEEAAQTLDNGWDKPGRLADQIRALKDSLVAEPVSS